MFCSVQKEEIEDKIIKVVLNRDIQFLELRGKLKIISISLLLVSQYTIIF